MLLVVDGRLVERRGLSPWARDGRLSGPGVEGVGVIEVGAGPDTLLLLHHFAKGHTRLVAIPTKIFCRRFCFSGKYKIDVE